MTAEEHIIAWIESSQPHYRKLLHISVPGNFLSDLGRAHACMNLAAEAYREMIKGGDAWASDHDASTIIGALFRLQSRGGAWRYYINLDRLEN